MAKNLSWRSGERWARLIHVLLNPCVGVGFLVLPTGTAGGIVGALFVPWVILGLWGFMY